MGVMDKFLNFMQLNDEDEDFPEDEYYDEEEEKAPVISKKASKKAEYQEEIEDTKPVKRQPVAQAPVNKVTNINRQATPVNTTRRISGSGMEVCVIRPTSFEDSREITLTLLSNRTVVLNLEGIDMDVAQRIIDFTSGSCFAMNGNLQKISHYIFIITPASVDISGDFQELFSGAFNSPLSTQ